MSARRAIVVCGIASLASTSCASREELNPLPTGAGTMDAGPVSDGGGGGAPEAGTFKRTIEQRNPFGNVAETENLLWDGDFEWFSAFSDQYGWLAGASMQSLGFTFRDVRLGAVCRSGLKCAGMAKKTVIAGLAVASRGNKIEASFWAHVKKGACDGVKGFITDMAEALDPDVAIPAVAKDPDAAGWCHFDAVMDPRKAKPILIIQNTSSDEAVIDDAVIKTVKASKRLSAPHGPLGAEAVADLAGAREAFGRLRGPHDPPPNDARRALERWKQR